MSDGRSGDAENQAPWRQSWPPHSYWARVAATLIAVVVSVALLWILRGVVLVLTASLVLAIGLQPGIRWFERRGLERGLALGLIVGGALVLGLGLAAVLVPFIIGQIAGLIGDLPEFVAQVESSSEVGAMLVDAANLDTLVEGGPESEAPEIDLVQLAAGLGGTLFNLVTVLAVTPYFAVRFPQLKMWIVRLLRPAHREDFLYVLNRSTDLIANYIVGNGVVSLIAGVVTYVGLELLGVRSSLALAAWVAFTDVIPIVGAFLGAAGVAAVAAFQGPEEVIGSLVLLLAYQLIENFFIAPRVMNRAVDLNPATVIVAIMVGGSLAGFIGAILALPLAAMIKIVVFERLVPERIDAVRKDGSANARRRLRKDGSLPLP